MSNVSDGKQKTSAETLYFADDDEVTEISERLIGRNRKVYEELAK